MAALLVDNFYFKTKENAEKHNTLRYEIVQQDHPTPVVRRGQAFAGAVTFKRPFEKESDVVQLVFSLGGGQTQATLGSVYIKRIEDVNKDSWNANLLQVENETLTFEVTAPVTAPIGLWSIRVVTRRRDSDDRLIYDHDQGVYILFNPWVVDDQTYMEDSGLLREYVLNDIGKIWNVNWGKPWIFGQYDHVVLDACMYVLDQAKLPYEERGNPVVLTRAVSRIVNANDDGDGGVLVGAWWKEYPDGTAPSLWTGSVEILEEYLRNKKPVRYGQCWVFAGVVTTVCRALGVPCRPITNLVSAHDKNSTFTVDKYFDENMQPLESESDFIWNFHVWNEVWMSRPDIGEGYDGWQAIDSTPQEYSDGFMQCGPAPIPAIKKGEVTKKYDVGFMLASVNGDLLRWRKIPSREDYMVVDTNDYHIGRALYTKKPLLFDPIGENDREDLVSQYKYRDGSDQERKAYMNGIRHSERAKRYYELSSAARDYIFRLHKLDFVDIGKDFELSVSAKNNSDTGRDMTITLVVYSIFSNGNVFEEIKKINQTTVWLGSKNRDELKMKVTPSEYLPKLVEGLHLRLSATAYVQGTDYSWADDDDFTFTTPKINIDFNEVNLAIGQQAIALLTFRNPLRIHLTNCEFRLNSAGFEGRALRVQVPDVGPSEVVRAETPVVPNKTGEIHIVATFQSSELNQINGATSRYIGSE